MIQDPVQTERRSFHFGRNLLCLCALVVLLYPLPFFFIRAPHFDQWSTSPYGRDLEYGMTATHLDADVVIYGDSAPFTGWIRTGCPPNWASRFSTCPTFFRR